MLQVHISQYVHLYKFDNGLVWMGYLGLSNIHGLHQYSTMYDLRHKVVHRRNGGVVFAKQILVLIIAQTSLAVAGSVS